MPWIWPFASSDNSDKTMRSCENKDESELSDDVHFTLVDNAKDIEVQIIEVLSRSVQEYVS